MPIDAATRLGVIVLTARLLDELQIPYLIGGSVASASYGEFRSTNDVDLVVDLPHAKVAKLVCAFEPFFYIDEVAVRRAVEHERSFNAIHSETIFKVDLFVATGEPYSREQFRRRVPRNLIESSEELVYLASPEDVILNKLRWLKAGDMISAQQPRDVASIIKYRGPELDLEYMRQWAAKLDVIELLEKALSESK